jgi:two-component system NtrC family sensor kinase
LIAEQTFAIGAWVAVRLRRESALVLSMTFALTGVAALAYWDGERESLRALEDFGREQETLAKGLAMAWRAGVTAGQGAAPEGRGPEAKASGSPPLAELASVERAGSLVVLLRAPGSAALRSLRNDPVSMETIIRGLDEGRPFVRLSRPEAAALGLPSRTALAGLARVEGIGREPWGVAVVATAERQRDRERRAQWRVTLGVALASALVLGFGGVALRNQRKELLLERELALADSRRERDERLERTSRAAIVGALAIGVTHEISTPLNVISARAEQLRDRLRTDERNAQAAQIIVEQTEHIDQIIRGMLRLARGGGPAGERVSAGAIAEAACALVEHRFTKAGVVLRRAFPTPLPAIHGDLRLLEHALVNLLLNACEACQAGGVVDLLVSTRDGHLVFTVVDDGIGISPRDIDQAMEPLFTTKGEGTGLGLTIVREVVASHRGTLSLTRAAPRGGTRAELALPIADEGHG